MQITSKAIAQTRPAVSRASLSFTFLAFVALLWMQTLAAAARGAPATFADLVEQVGGAVVNITTTTKMATPIGPQGVSYQRAARLKICFVAPITDNADRAAPLHWVLVL